MIKEKRNLLFISINVLLVLVVGLILGFCLPIAQDGSLLLSFILMLITLLTPSLLFLTTKDATSPVSIASIIFIVGNLVTLIVFMCMVRDIKVVGITEAAILGAYLIVMLICVACLPEKKEA